MISITRLFLIHNYQSWLYSQLRPWSLQVSRKLYCWQLDNYPYVSEIPSEEVIIEEGKKLIESSVTWKAGKTFFNSVQTSYRAKEPGDGAPWYCRISEHTPKEVTFDQLWEKLSKNKAVNEKESCLISLLWLLVLLIFGVQHDRFIHEIKKVTKVKEISPNASIWTLYYTFTPPVSPRVFTELQVTHLSETTPRTGWMKSLFVTTQFMELITFKRIIVSLAIDLSSKGDEELLKLEEKGVRGRYVSVERIIELENGNTEWRMATSSTPGGSLPNFIVESTMAKKIATVRTVTLPFFGFILIVSLPLI